MMPSRRGIIVSVVAAAAGAAAIGYGGWRFFGKHYAPTPYDDLLTQLPDRDLAMPIGRAFLATHANFTTTQAAAALRARLHNRDLAAVSMSETARGELSVAGGWMMPATLLGLCALAARTQKRV